MCEARRNKSVPISLTQRVEPRCPIRNAVIHTRTIHYRVVTDRRVLPNSGDRVRSEPACVVTRVSRFWRAGWSCDPGPSRRGRGEGVLRKQGLRRGVRGKRLLDASRGTILCGVVNGGSGALGWRLSVVSRLKMVTCSKTRQRPVQAASWFLQRAQLQVQPLRKTVQRASCNATPCNA